MPSPITECVHICISLYLKCRNHVWRHHSVSSTQLCICAHVLHVPFPFLFWHGTESVPSGESQSVAGGDEDALDDYQELSTREEQDIESMMEMCEYAISNAEAFAEQLSRELQVLDGVSETTPKKWQCSATVLFFLFKFNANPILQHNTYSYCLNLVLL